jgi:hypothetical protein
MLSKYHQPIESRMLYKKVLLRHRLLRYFSAMIYIAIVPTVNQHPKVTSKQRPILTTLSG